MDFSSDPDRDQIRAAVQKLCAEFGDTYWREVDRKSEYPEKFVDALTRAGWLAALIPTEYGGAGPQGAGAAGHPPKNKPPWRGGAGGPPPAENTGALPPNRRAEPKAHKQ